MKEEDRRCQSAETSDARDIQCTARKRKSLLKKKKVGVAEGIREVSAIQLENRWPGGAVGTRSATPLFSDIPRGGISLRGGKWVGDGIF